MKRTPQNTKNAAPSVLIARAAMHLDTALLAMAVLAISTLGAACLVFWGVRFMAAIGQATESSVFLDDKSNVLMLKTSGLEPKHHKQSTLSSSVKIHHHIGHWRGLADGFTNSKHHRE